MESNTDRRFYINNTVLLWCLFCLGITSKIAVFSSYERIISHTACLILTPVVLFILFYNFRLKREYQGYSIFAVLYLLINLIALYRGLFADYYPWDQPRQIPIYVLNNSVSQLLPLFIFIRFNALSTLIRISKLSCFLFFVIVLLNANIYFNPSAASSDYAHACNLFAPLRVAAYNASFLLFLPGLADKRFVKFSIVVVIVLLGIATILARRGTEIMGLLMLGIYFLSTCNLRKVLAITVLLILGAIIFYSFSDYFTMIIDSRPSGVMARNDLLQTQLSQTSFNELIWGKGAFGYYKGYNFQFDDIRLQYFDVYRFSSEIGIMDIILKSGIVGLVIHILTFGLAAINGLFFAKSRVGKGFGMIILIALIELIPFGIQRLSFFYVALWIFASMLYSRRFRELSDNDIQKLISDHEL